ncbi:MAG: inositol monophosphatase [Actinomycetales bacterium]|nr:inositol monophosphatase [Actinomycetales bacterium]
MIAGDQTVSELREIAFTAAARAGEFLATRPDVLEVSTKSSATDVVTQMDIGAERIILEVIGQRRPWDTVMSEEGGGLPTPSGQRAAPPPTGVVAHWVIDPLDGTTNYLYDWPTWSVSIAAQVAGETVVGVVEVPRLGERYWAVHGGGAYRRDARGEHRLHVSPATDLSLALVCTGFGYTADRRAEQGRVVADLLSGVRDLRRGGSAAIDLAFVACGRLDAFFERGLNAWDHAAGALLVREAGGVVSGLGGDAESERMLIASAPGLHGQICSLLDGIISPTR